ncbi:MAG: YciI family protein [Gemmatimonadaceae bacterium]
MAFALAIIRYRRPLEDVVANTDDHRAYLRTLQERGTLVASGPFDPRYGGALLLNLPDQGTQEALDAVRDGDPFWQRGIAQYELLRWNPVIGKDALDALVATP